MEGKRVDRAWRVTVDTPLHKKYCKILLELQNNWDYLDDEWDDLDSSNTAESSYISGGFTTTDVIGPTTHCVIHVHGFSRKYQTREPCRLARIKQKERQKPEIQILLGSWEDCVTLLAEACERLQGIPDTTMVGRARLETLRSIVLNLSDPHAYKPHNAEYNAIAETFRRPGLGSSRAKGCPSAA